MNPRSSLRATAEWTVDALDATGAGLSAVFSHSADRFSHQVVLRDSGGAWVPLLESVDQGESEVWPPSPTLQEVHLEPQAGERTVLLSVGRAGKSHWSLSVEPETSPLPALVFDVACRVKETPIWLGSRYKRLAGVSSEDRFAEGGATFRCANSTVTLTIESPAPENSAAQLEWSDSEIAIPANPIPTLCPATIRWKYRVALA